MLQRSCEKNKEEYYRHGFEDSISIQLTFICSKPTIETLEKGVKYVQS